MTTYTDIMQTLHQHLNQFINRHKYTSLKINNEGQGRQGLRVIETKTLYSVIYINDSYNNPLILTHYNPRVSSLQPQQLDTTDPQLIEKLEQAITDWIDGNAQQNKTKTNKNETSNS